MNTEIKFIPMVGEKWSGLGWEGTYPAAFDWTRDGRRVRIWFRHKVQFYAVSMPTGLPMPPREGTLARILVERGVGEPDVEGRGQAICHPKDQYDRFVGRNKALLMAMKAAGLDKAERTAIWSAWLCLP